MTTFCFVAPLQILSLWTWNSWSFRSCATACAGTCRTSRSPSSPPRWALRWSKLQKVSGEDARSLLTSGGAAMRQDTVYFKKTRKTSAEIVKTFCSHAFFCFFFFFAPRCPPLLSLARTAHNLALQGARTLWSWQRHKQDMCG